MDYEIIARKLSADLAKAFPVLDILDRAAIIGNGGHESGGFKTLQETRPAVSGSRGGYGYFQWTGPRRRAFEAWCEKRQLAPASYEANSGFLIFELQTAEKGAIGNVRRAKGLDAKVKAFELGYERAGVKHYDSRIRYARRALAVLGIDEKEAPEVEAMKPKPPKPMAQSTTLWAQIASIVTTVGGAALAVVKDVDWQTVAVVSAAAVAVFGIYTISERFRHARENGV